MDNKIVVLAAYRKHFDSWIREIPFSDDRKLFHFANAPDHLRGRRFSAIVRLWSWEDAPDAFKLYELAKTRLINQP